MKYFVETVNYNEQFISLGITAENGRVFYQIFNDFDQISLCKNKESLEEIVLPLMNESNSGSLKIGDIEEDFISFIEEVGYSPSNVANRLIHFLTVTGEEIELYSYDNENTGFLLSRLFRIIDNDINYDYCISIKQMLKDKLYNTPFYENNNNGIIDAWFGWEKPEEAMALIKTYDDYPEDREFKDSLAKSNWSYDLYRFVYKLGSH